MSSEVRIQDIRFRSTASWFALLLGIFCEIKVPIENIRKMVDIFCSNTRSIAHVVVGLLDCNVHNCGSKKVCQSLKMMYDYCKDLIVSISLQLCGSSLHEIEKHLPFTHVISINICA